EERPDAVGARAAVDVLVVVAMQVEGHEGLAGALGPLAEGLVEHRLPRGGVDSGRVRQHAVEVEEARAHRVGQAEHGRQTLRSAARATGRYGVIAASAA